jgi:hypothetical protein
MVVPYEITAVDDLVTLPDELSQGYLNGYVFSRYMIAIKVLLVISGVTFVETTLELRL